ncbi:PrsW family glutamic-type intramembrane protease [Pedococcus sp. KACC 23699]|uniref:PrsW family glutamic-type intramembrane protease n=1 Tax=Pedococcus sp. KACC 23699 TaxID=3149228 RepID=A0AAU7JX88_9MICO
MGLFGLFAVAPFLILRLTGDDQDIHRIAWGFALYFALLWFVVLYALIAPEDRDWWRLGRIALATAFAGTAIAIFLEKHIAPDDTSLVTMILGVGLPEEFAKALAIYFFVFRSTRPSSTRTYLFAGAVSGLAFGAAEAVSYTQKFADLASYMSASSYTALVTWRLLTDSLLHAILAGICAYFIGLAYADSQRRWALIGAGLGLAAVLHGAYDAWAANWAGTLTAAMIIFIFAGYVRSGDRIAERLVIGNPTDLPALSHQSGPESMSSPSG